METAGRNIFWEIIEVFDKKGLLPHFMIVGSWAEYLYSEAFEENVRAGLRTRDIDIFIPNIYKPAGKVSFSDELENLGFSFDECYVSGVGKFFSTDGFELEFLARRLGKGERTIKIPSLDITVESIRELDLLAKYPLVVKVDGFDIVVPEPAAYLLQKLIVSSKRKTAEKQQKDLDSADYILFNIESYGCDLARVVEIFSNLHPSQQKIIRQNANRLIFEFAKIEEFSG